MDHWFNADYVRRVVLFAVSNYEVVGAPCSSQRVVRIHSSTKDGRPIVRLYEITVVDGYSRSSRRGGRQIVTLQDTVANWEGPATLFHGTLVVNGQPIQPIRLVLPRQSWFLRIVKATLDEQRALLDAGYIIKDAGVPRLCRMLCVACTVLLRSFWRQLSAEDVPQR